MILHLNNHHNHTYTYTLYEHVIWTVYEHMYTGKTLKSFWNDQSSGQKYQKCHLKENHKDSDLLYHVTGCVRPIVYTSQIPRGCGRRGRGTSLSWTRWTVSGTVWVFWGTFWSWSSPASPTPGSHSGVYAMAEVITVSIILQIPICKRLWNELKSNFMMQ